jgi:Fe2+ or Zn2+ uptake regulation protein
MRPKTKKKVTEDGLPLECVREECEHKICMNCAQCEKLCDCEVKDLQKRGMDDDDFEIDEMLGYME